LSITYAPSGPSLIARACSNAKSPDTARNTNLHSRAAATVNSSTATSPYIPAATNFPADRADANNRSRDTGNATFSNTLMISTPTAPVAPTMPTTTPPPPLPSLLAIVTLSERTATCDLAPRLLDFPGGDLFLLERRGGEMPF
jgi:hypothetical protein